MTSQISAPFEFASTAWLELLRALVTERARTHPELPDQVVCEVYRNAPAHLAPHPSRSIAWTSVKRGGRGTLLLEELMTTQCDVKIVGEYAAFLPLARFFVAADSQPAYLAQVEQAKRLGHISVLRDIRPPDRIPDYWLHNSLARRTR